METENIEKIEIDTELTNIISSSTALSTEEKQELLDIALELADSDDTDAKSYVKSLYILNNENIYINRDDILENPYLREYEFDDMVERVKEIGVVEFCKMLDIDIESIETNISQEDEEENLKEILNGYDGDLVSQYFLDIKDYPLLTHQEEIILAKRIEKAKEEEENIENGIERDESREIIERGVEAKDILWTSNLRWVISIAKRYRRGNLEFNDIIQYGNIGLDKAIKKFDYRRGNRFATYATYWIKQTIQRELDDNSDTIRLPVHVNDKIRSIKSFKKKFTVRNGRTPSIEEIASGTGLNEDTINKTIENMKILSISSLDMEYNNDENDTSLLDFLADPKQITDINAEKSVMRNYYAKIINNHLEKLPVREKKIIEFRYGLNNNEVHTLEQAGRRFGITRERVGQIEEVSLRKLNRYISDEKGKLNLES